LALRSKPTNSFNPQFLKENHQRQFLYPKVREAIIPHNRKNPISKQEKPYLSIFIENKHVASKKVLF